LVESDGSVLRVTLNRPESGNSIDMEMASALLAVFSDLDENVSVVVLAAAGKVFCAGGDVGEFARADDPGTFISELAAELHRAILAMQASRVPVVAAVHGNVGGAGLGLVASCDIAVAAAGVRFRPAYVALGLTPDGSLTWRLASQLGTVRTLDLLMTDGQLTADEARAAGLVSRITDDLDGEVASLIQTLCAGPLEAYTRLKALVYGAAQRTVAEQLDLEAAAIAASARSADGQEGIAAFTDRRKPVFGRAGSGRST